MKDSYGYICNMNQEDFEFTTKVVEQATKESISDELDIAKKCVQERQLYRPQEELGLDYNLKNGRIRNYIYYYSTKLQNGELVRYNQENKEQDIESIYNNIVNGKHNKSYINMDERIALSIAAKYISTLNDHEFIQLLQDTEQITPEQYQSLTRKYKDIPNLKQEAYTGKNWKEIKEAQKQATIQEDKKGEEK